MGINDVFNFVNVDIDKTFGYFVKFLFFGLFLQCRQTSIVDFFIIKNSDKYCMTFLFKIYFYNTEILKILSNPRSNIR